MSSGDYSTITVDADLVKMAEEEKESWQRRSIYKLPTCVTRDKPAYTPQVVSFGPYHCKNENLKPMEEHKNRTLKHFLKRSEITHQQCMESLSKIVGDLMDAYDSLDAEFRNNPDAFLELMIRDGCFMLEIFRAQREKLTDYAENDPIFSDHGRLYLIPHIKRDMIMLENQLPMKVLHKLHQLQKGLATDNKANKLVFDFFFPKKSDTTAMSGCLHILDMYREVILGPDPGKGKKKRIPEGDDIIRSAVELDEAGIKMKKSITRSLRDITFEDGVLTLPMITVDDITEPLFLNLIAFERFHVGAGNDVTAYVFFMDNIIDDALDIRLLHSKDIIQNGIGSDKAAAKLINSLSKDISLDKNSHLGEVYKRINAYCKRKIPRLRIGLYRWVDAFLARPWPIVSVFAGFILFGLTITQTAYSILSYHKGQV